MPGDPDENGRCCLNGVRLGEVDVEGPGADVEDEAAVEIEGTGGDVDGVEVVGTIGSTIGPLAGGG